MPQPGFSVNDYLFWLDYLPQHILMDRFDYATHKIVTVTLLELLWISILGLCG
jgi:hypothetical protein